MRDPLTLSAFQDQLHTRFRVGDAIELQLAEVTDLGSSPRHQQFSVVFRSPLTTFLPQRMYGMEHDVLGRLELFIVPIGKDPAGFLYEAIFNRVEAGTA